MQQRFIRATDFRQERDFGQKIGATFEFLGAHWKPLGKCLLYFVLPLTLVMGIGLGLIMNPMWAMLGAAGPGGPVEIASRYDSGFSSMFFSGFGLVMLGMLLGLVTLLTTVYSYVRLVVLYDLHGIFPTPTQVWQQMKSFIGRVTLAFLFFLGLYLVFAFVMAAFFGMFINALGGGWSVLLVFLFMGTIFYAVVPLVLYFPILFLEERGIVSSLPRCYSLIRGKWWSTLGLMVVVFIMQSMLSVIFALPQYGILLGKMLHLSFLDSDVFGILSRCLYATGMVLTYVISLVAPLFQYFNLVERKEGFGLRMQVMSLGQTPAPTVANQHLRPDDEGEY
jgi:hypothetical protein